MRCGACLSYIPEGLPEPIVCPSCGKPAARPAQATTAEPKVSPAPAPATEPAPAPEPKLTIGASPSETQPSFSTAKIAVAEPELRASTPPPVPAGTTDAGRANTAFAPYFTIPLKLAYGPAAAPAHAASADRGSLSFGPEGFSIVASDGRQWEKILYRDIRSLKQDSDSLVLTIRDTETRLTVYHPWLPEFLSGPRRKRATTVLELLAKVRGGLTPFEIASFQRRLS